MNRRIRRYGLFAVTTLSLLSLRDAQADDFCADSDTTYDLRTSSVTRSLAAGVLHPVKGDERFFDAAAVSGPTAPSSIMFLLDNSGSMMWFPQCTSGWGASNTACAVPSMTDPEQPSSTNSYAPVVRARSDFSGTRIAWMHAIKPIETYADPGYDDGSGYLKDAPPWTPTPAGTCDASTQNCLFEKDKAYQVENWDEVSATPEPGDGCSKYDSNGNIDKDHYGNEITAGDACRTSLATNGFYQYRVRYVSGVDRWGRRVYDMYPPQNESARFVVSGKWLNANPPKYVSARRAIKQLLRIDPLNPKSRDNVRYGLSTFWSNTATGADLCGSGNNSSTQCSGTTSYQQGDGATLLVPLGPDCTHTDRADHVTSRQTILGAVNGTGAKLLKFPHSTPLAESLFNVAQYFSVQGTGGNHYLRFGDTWTKAGTPAGISYWAGQDFRQCSSGVVGASWAGCSADGSSTNPNQRSVCWSCQVSAAIVVTDGMPTTDEALPSRGSSHAWQPKTPEGDADSTLGDTEKAWGLKTWQPTAYKGACGANRGAYGDKCGGSYLPLVAYYLNHYDQVPESTMEGKQNVLVHTISFGLADGTAKTMLQATANLGGGRFADTSDASGLEAALTTAVNNVVARQTAFSSANSNALQTNRNQATETYFARFKPSTAPPQWEGHLAQAILFDEFAMGCDPTKLKSADSTTVPCGNVQHSPNFDGNVDGDGKNVCDGVFLVDQNCQEITESSSDGSFVLVNDPDRSASLPWDAGKVLCNPNGAYLGTAVPCTALHASFVSAADDTAKVTAAGKDLRTVYTYLGPKVGLVEFKTTDAATLTALRKAMSLDQPFCDSLLRTTSGCVGGVCHSPPNLNTDDMNQCAKLLIYYVRGFDVFDIDADTCRSPVNSGAGCATASVGEERMWKLGDIFHSTPAVVKPPPHSEVCDTGYDSQCAATIYSPQWLKEPTPIDRSADGVDAYAAWRAEQIDRKRVVLAGANDGMLHAFDAGAPILTAERDRYGSVPYDSGTGKELWAFIPPDLLPRLKLLIDRHQYMVDGPTMVRDVWVDGGADGKGTKDRRKQKDEFHTVAILSERSGGSQFVALDVSDPRSPKFLWSFPEPNSEDARWMAESWADFAPRPPPIGPVRIAADKSVSPRGFDELWVVMLNGGYDPAMVKGRAVFMVDVWTGKTVWRFTDDDVKAMKGATTGAGMFPVAASVAMVDLGDPLKSSFDRDGFFDTATWGDLGGNLWVARFHEPGALTDGLVTNWFAGRAFEQQRQAGTTDTMGVSAATAFNPSSLGQVRSPFFHMTANSWESQTRTLRTFVGSGNREQILQKGRECNPDNVWGCIQAGCSEVIVETKDEFGACTQTQRLDYVNGTFAYSSTNGCGTTGPVCGVSPGFKTTTTYDITCGGTKHPTIKGTMTCNALGVCSQYTEVGTNPLTGGLAAPAFRDRFYGIWSYGGPDQKRFSTQADAKTFDDNRFTDVDYSGTCGGGVDGTACRLVDVTWAKVTYDPEDPGAGIKEECLPGHKPCVAKATDPGWFFEYGQVCQDASCTKTWDDERTASPANVVLGCAAWNGFRPTGSGTTPPPTDVCKAAPAETSSYSYLADFVTGLPTAACGFAYNGIIYRSYERNTWSPPSAAMARVSFNQQGQVSYSTLNLDPGAPPSHTTIGVQEVGADQVYELEVTREAHECRHVSDASCE